MKVLVLGMFVGVFATFGVAYAETGDPGVNARQHHQRLRIHQGIRSGELTKDEARGLVQQQAQLRQEERRYKSDGKLTREERADLHHELNSVSRDIYNEKHDDEQR